VALDALVAMENPEGPGPDPGPPPGDRARPRRPRRPW
jgi:hypothetical protein